MSEPTRRKHRRFYLCLPLSVHLQEREKIAGPLVPKPVAAKKTYTENISSGGCYFSFSYPPSVGSEVELELTIPARGPGWAAQTVRCWGRVVRVEKERGGGIVGVAATIENYQFLDPPAAAEPELIPRSGRSSRPAERA